MTAMGFGSMEEMLAYMEDQERRANKLVVEEQWAIKEGDHWCRPVPEMGIFEFGIVLTMEESLQGEDEEDLDFIRANIQERNERGYRFSRAYSVMEPQGMLGDTHVLNMWPIKPEEFEAAKAGDWDVLNALGLGAEWIQRIMTEAQQAKRRQRKAGSLDGEIVMEVVEDEN
jgi:hypothetical protein